MDGLALYHSVSTVKLVNYDASFLLQILLISASCAGHFTVIFLSFFPSFFSGTDSQGRGKGKEADPKALHCKPPIILHPNLVICFCTFRSFSYKVFIHTIQIIKVISRKTLLSELNMIDRKLRVEFFT